MMARFTPPVIWSHGFAVAMSTSAVTFSTSPTRTSTFMRASRLFTDEQPERDQRCERRRAPDCDAARHFTLRLAETEVRALSVPQPQPDRSRERAEEPQVPRGGTVPQHFAAVAHAVDGANSDVQ